MLGASGCGGKKRRKEVGRLAERGLGRVRLREVLNCCTAGHPGGQYKWEEELAGHDPSCPALGPTATPLLFPWEIPSPLPDREVSFAG